MHKKELKEMAAILHLKTFKPEILFLDDEIHLTFKGLKECLLIRFYQNGRQWSCYDIKTGQENKRSNFSTSYNLDEVVSLINSL